MNRDIYILIPYTKSVYCISSDNKQLLKKIEAYYGQLVLYHYRPDAIFIKKINYYKNILSFCDLEDNKVILVSSHIDLIVSYVFNYIRDNIVLEKNFNLYHASCVEIDNQVYMFVGSSSSGKTTMTAYLSNKPHSNVISEDMTIINYLTRQVISVPKPLLMRINSYNLLKENYGVKFERFESLVYNGSERVVVTNIIEKTNKKIFLDKIFFLHLDKNKCKIKRCEGFKELLYNSYSNKDTFQNICSAVSLSKKVPMYDLFYYDLGEAYEIIKNSK